MKTWIIDYVVGNTYRVKRIKANTAQAAIKKSRLKNIVDINELKGDKNDFDKVFR